MPLGATIGAGALPYVPNVAAMGAVVPLAPNEIPNMYLWLDAGAGLFQDAAKTIVAAANLDPVGAWADQSGNNRHILQSNDAIRPRLLTVDQGGKPAVNFGWAGAGTPLSRAGNTMAGAYTIFYVLQHVHSGGTVSHTIAWVPTTWSLLAKAHLGNVSAGASPFLSWTSAAGYFVYAITYNGGSSEVRKNGVVVASGNMGTTIFTNKELWIGKHNTYADYWVGGKMLEMVWYTGTLSLNQIMGLEMWLNTKYAIY